jgi:predicted metalloprotease with PDZ domain
MTLRHSLFLLAGCISFALSAQQRYSVSLDLNVVQDDRIKVVVNPPAGLTGEVEYSLPKVVPGTYSIANYGRFVQDFAVLDAKGMRLSSSKVSENTWKIEKAEHVATIEYWVNDTYDYDKSGVFEPAGTNIEEGENFLLNLFGFVGYIEGKDKLPYTVNVAYPQTMYGTSALKRDSAAPGFDRWVADSYFLLHDSPIMYAAPDTASTMVGGALITIHSYSPTGMVSAAFMMNQVTDLFEATRVYLGGTLPVDRYVILAYYLVGEDFNRGFGALEHWNSTVFFLPEVPTEYIAQEIIDITAHEFLHIITPLNIHSEEIGEFNFSDPKMSKHLWMYEGVTEYTSHLVQVKAGLVTEEDFVATMQEKIESSLDRFNDRVPFTILSKYCLDIYRDEYNNVYQKGALIGMCLDLTLLDWSDGEYDLAMLMRDLSGKYGSEKSFKDDALFDDIEAFTAPEIREFFIRYVEGAEPLPLEECFAYAGIAYRAERELTLLSFTGASYSVNETTGRLIVLEADDMDDFGKGLVLVAGDEMVSFDGMEINIENYATVIETYRRNRKPGDIIEVVVERTDSKGKTKTLKLKAKTVLRTVVVNNSLTQMQNPTTRQRLIRKAWINN